MSSPTGSDPNYPQGGAPQGQPGWGAPETPAQGYSPQQGYNPAPTYSGAPAGYGAAAGQRPGMVSAAAIIAIVWGGLGALFGLLAMAVAFALFPILGLFVLIGVAVAVALLVGGIQVLQGKSPKLLLYICYAAIAINLIELIIAITQSGTAYTGILGIIIPGVIVALLLQQQSKQWFASRGLTY